MALGTAETFDSLLSERIEATQKRPKPSFEIIPHPNAPLFSGEGALENFNTFVDGLIEALEEGKDIGADLLDLIRQAGLVSLWFFGKFIAGHGVTGNLLNDALHLDMCNFRQSLLDDGCRGAMFIPRAHYKSVTVTELGCAWELTRNPDLRIRITSAVSDYAHDFMNTVKEIIESPFYAQVYPAHSPDRNQSRWNNSEIVMPNRSRKMREASIEAGGIGGASQGHHYDLHVVDDPIGEGDLNAMYQSSATMLAAKKWFWASEKTLLVSPKVSRVIVVGTRYAVDDMYGDIIKRAYINYGYPMKDWEPNENGAWRVYYRRCIEDGEVIFPENFSIKIYQNMAEEDWWTFVTQYLNEPTQSGLTEFSAYSIKTCWLEYVDERDDWMVFYPSWDPNASPGELIGESLSNMDLVMAIDPAATEKYVSAKTSRSSLGLMARSADDKRFFIQVKADYIAPSRLFDWAFEEAKRLGRYLRATYLEANAGFKVLGPIFREEETKRQTYLNLQPFAAVGDKDARIRSALQPELEAGRLYVAEPFLRMVEEEQKAFPQSMKKDILDMMSIAVSNSIKPYSAEERELIRAKDEEYRFRTSNATGY